ncbi:hypothetical protein J4N45_14410 [Vibrio sp. SCSIO 43140]|uniref:hypothetical protein n=1 Tax=Vibrio sp. SCSIO 43140 TaxID=2819100 RepID=UPI0020765CF9|nr:hypothetical protein [Vibrio sp. SCSIO 43140]USD58818.1 hypothetical protein J4N45_09775 [Vibrio sp. SCSIO 43140]USD59152.1 hypothetical protein J4N45_11480 [Vibrio sp. SCSIO 43140]USD59695.1 hypothetical protein J4N45_14410 [Vibrio sp. SCSIO 43140]
MKIEAINPSKWQAVVNRFVSQNERYKWFISMGKDETLTCHLAHERALIAWNKLTKREQKNIGKHIDTTGY